MQIKLVFIALFLIALVVETTLVAFPFVFILSLFSVVLFKSVRMIVIVFIATIAIDMLRVGHLGTTALMVLGFALLASLYQRTLHAADILIFSIIIFILSLIYEVVVGYSFSLLWSIIIFGLLWGLLYNVYSKQGIVSERSAQ